MRRNVIKLLLVGAPLLGLLYITFNSLVSSSGKNVQHSLKKRNNIDQILATYFKEENDYEAFEHDEWVRDVTSTNEPLPGFLVCNVRKDARGPEESDPRNGVYPPKENSEKSKSRARGDRVASNPLIPPNRPIGCCPPGDRSGQPYKFGFTCCMNTVINVSTHFCCISKSRVMNLTEEELDFCYPKDNIPFCRMKDLEMESKQPMTHRCPTTKKKTPKFCRFDCPQGSQPKDGIQTATCQKNGEWNRKPICCEGCPADFRLDLWLVVEVDQKFGFRRFKQLKEFLKSMLSYLPVSQDGVRVGITIFNTAVYFDVGVWNLLAHDGHGTVYDAIDELPFEGSGSSTGKALSWIANNAFTSQNGDREDVPNQVVAVLYGEPDDEFFEAAMELKTIAQVMAVGIGQKISNDNLALIGSDEVHRVDKFKDLLDITRILYKSLCGEKCL